jgi:hypothetical protein
MILIDGKCNAPEKLLRATKPGTNIIMVKDHAIAVVNCLSIDATETATGVGGVVARQHTVIDYDTIIFGLLPGGTHVSLTEYSIASYLRSAWITDDAAYHARATYFSKLSLDVKSTCPSSGRSLIITTRQRFQSSRRRERHSRVPRPGCLQFRTLAH